MLVRLLCAQELPLWMPNVHSADGWEDVLKPVLARYYAEARPSITRRRFRLWLRDFPTDRLKHWPRE